MPVGGAVFAGNSKLFSGPLGIVSIGFKGYDLGKTTADATLVPDQDIKDIMYQQEGTKPADHVRTGQEYLLNVTFGEIKTGLLDLLMAGVSTSITSSSDDGGVLGRSQYQSMLTAEAGVLRVAAVDEDGDALTATEHLMNFYYAIPIVNGDLINWGADTQRNMPVQFRIKWRTFTAIESSTHSGAFGYWGDPTPEDVPAVVWPDVAGPTIVSAASTTATNMDVVFNENIAYQTAHVNGHYVAKVDGVLVLSTGSSITDATISITFPASTFDAGDTEVEVYISSLALEDTESTANPFAGVDAHPVTNSV